MVGGVVQKQQTDLCVNPFCRTRFCKWLLIAGSGLACQLAPWN